MIDCSYIARYTPLLLLAMHLACSAPNGSTPVPSPARPPLREATEKRAAPPSEAPPPSNPEAEDERPGEGVPREIKPAAPQRYELADDPTPAEEIVITLPRGMEDDDDPSALPEERDALRKRAKKELEAGNTDDALSIIDVLLVMNPDDAELLEIRGDIMLKRDLAEDAAVDFRRCCRLGRETCCR